MASSGRRLRLFLWTAGSVAAGLLAILALYVLDGGTDRASPPGDREPRDANRDLLAPPPTLAGRPEEGARELAGGTDAPKPMPPAWRVVGTVAREDGRPVEGAEVSITLERGTLRHRAAAPTTDRSGRYAAELPALASLPPVPRATTRLLARATAPGHRPSEERPVPVPLATDPREIVIDLVLVEGASLRGRVVDAAGRPVLDAIVEMDGPSKGLARTDADGAYVLGLTGKGAHHLHASVIDVGTGTLDVSLDEGGDARAPDLVLRGPGTLAGVAVLPDGRLAPDVAVYAFFEEGDRAADGIGFAVAWSGGDGRFRFAGLRPGRWVLGAWGRPRDGEEPRTWATGSDQARVLVDRPAVRIRVVDADGHPVPGAAYTIQGRSPGHEFGHTGTVERADGIVALGVDVGTTVRFSASVGDAVRTAIEVQVDEGRGETSADAVLEAASPPTGRLRVRIEGPDGTTVRAFTASLRRADEGMRMIDYSALTPQDEEGSLPPVPPGRYVLEIYPGRAASGPPVGLYFRVETPVVVSAGEETVVDVRARQGGRLRLTVHVPEGRRAPVDVGASVTPLDGGSPQPLHSFVTYRESAFTVSGSIAPGVPNVAGPLLEPGRHALRVTAGGFRPAEALTDVVAGRLTDVEVWLVPE